MGRTAAVSGILLSFGSVPLYLVMAGLYSDIVPELHSSMILAAILIPVSTVSGVVQAVNMGYRPHVVSYSLLLFQTIKIPLVLALVYFLDLGIDGIIMAIFLATLAKIIAQIFFARKKLIQKFNPVFLYRWLKMWWIPVYAALGEYIWLSGVTIFPLITGSVVGVAYYAAAVVVSQLVYYTNDISRALYSKLLAAGKHEYIRDSLTRQLFFMLPMLGAVIAFSKPALYVLNPEYQEAYLIVIFLAFYTFVSVLVTFFKRILTGLEKIDIRSDPSFRGLIHSKLFLVSTINNISGSIYIAILVVVLLLLKDSNVSELHLATVWSVLQLVLSVPFATYYLVLARRMVEMPFPGREVLVYGMATLALVGAYYATVDSFITFDADIYVHITQMAVLLAVCIGIYFAITYAADPKTRSLTRLVISEIGSLTNKRA